MKRYELKFLKGVPTVFKVSLVKGAAIETNLVHFSKEEEEVHTFTNEEEMKIYSVVMRPNIDIFRKNINGEPANVFYTKETVDEQQINYFRNNGNFATNINHSSIADAEGIFPFESWIVKDAKTDRATTHFNMDVREGDWVMGHKVDNVELWSEHIKEGKLDGLSIEATNINYVEMNTDKKSGNAVLAFLQESFNKVFKDAAEFAVEGEETEEEKAARIAKEEADAAAAGDPPAGDPPAGDPPAGDPPAGDPPAEDELSAEEIKALQDENADLKAKIATLKADKVKAEADLETMTADKKEVDKKLVEMGKQTPAASKIKNLPKAESLEMTKENYPKMTNVQKMKFNKENRKY